MDRFPPWCEGPGCDRAIAARACETAEVIEHTTGQCADRISAGDYRLVLLLDPAGRGCGGKCRRLPAFPRGCESFSFRALLHASDHGAEPAAVLWIDHRHG